MPFVRTHERQKRRATRRPKLLDGARLELATSALRTVTASSDNGRSDNRLRPILFVRGSATPAAYLLIVFMASYSRWAEIRAERLLDEWRRDRELRRRRRELRAESRRTSAHHVAEIQDALAVLERAILSDSCLIGDGKERRRAAKGLLACKGAFETWIETYRPLTSEKPRSGPGRAPETFWAGCRDVLARWPHLVTRDGLARFLRSPQFYGRLTAAEKRALFGTVAGSFPSLPRIIDKLYSRPSRKTSAQNTPRKTA
jgi:hypothetical protein